MSDEPKKADVYAYQLIVHGPTGQGWTYTKKFFSEPELIKQAAESDLGLITSLLHSGKILVQEPGGPPRVVMSVIQLFALMGISPPYVSASGVTGDLQGRVVVGAVPGILGPNGSPLGN